jgi:CDP-paratose 2-epimerase
VTPPQPALGVLEWFEVGEHERAERVIRGLRELGVEHVRTGLSWAGWHTPGGAEWYDWLFPRLAAHFELLPCVLYTPPSLGIAPRTSAPPRRPRDYADFVDTALSRYGEHFRRVELWNEPNNREEWDWTLDPEWKAFAEMVGDAAYWARERGCGVVLGGMSPIDPSWLWLMGERGVLDLVDVVGIHGFPGTWEASWEGWSRHVELVQEVLDERGSKAEIWITEAGYSTVRHDDLGQLQAFLDVLTAPVPRVYWYSAEDLAAQRASLGGFHVDERDYHFGLRRADGAPKLLARVLGEGGLPAVRETARLARPSIGAAGPVALVTGGAGFVGTNLADRLAQEGHRVRIFDNLSRPGVERNLRWLRERHPQHVEVQIADVRDPLALQRAVENVDQVFHFAAQVAVTTSLDDPRADFEVNAGGTFNLLDALRRLDEPPPLVFTSTNKVYGTLPDVPFERDGERWEPRDPQLRLHGLDESLPLDFCTPYGCSKGAADQYVLDHAKSCGLPAAVFRMSCIYGPHQHGTEDQGWVAHFLLRALAGEQITIYGDGAQVRDVLWVEDLVDALLRARDGIDGLAGLAFNVGGGADNSVSLLEVIELIADVHGSRPRVELAPARPGDQRYYVADTRRLESATGWRQQVGVAEGIEELYRWLRERSRRTSRAGIGVAAR